LGIAIASGAEHAAGLVASIVAGFLISALGGGRVQIGGPTGAFIVVVSFGPVDARTWLAWCIAFAILVFVIAAAPLVDYLAMPALAALTDCDRLVDERATPLVLALSCTACRSIPLASDHDPHGC
jgi:hypothetical protein